MTDTDFIDWLAAYGRAWMDGDPDAVVRLFAADAAYHETPYAEPMCGHAAIHRYWTEGAATAQTHIHFEATPIVVRNGIGYAHWRARFRRRDSGRHVCLDGMLQATFDDARQCREFREWWHRAEHDA
jgi:ketosteroid isomerase-like protein